MDCKAVTASESSKRVYGAGCISACARPRVRGVSSYIRDCVEYFSCLQTAKDCFVVNLMGTQINSTLSSHWHIAARLRERNLRSR